MIKKKKSNKTLINLYIISSNYQPSLLTRNEPHLMPGYILCMYDVLFFYAHRLLIAYIEVFLLILIESHPGTLSHQKTPSMNLLMLENIYGSIVVSIFPATNPAKT